MKSVLVQAMGLLLILISWVFLGLLAAGDRWISPIPRTEKQDDYL
jgi:hypothetical protein